ncbi:unnamed protein product, partial [Lymnaea stagnalis]
DGFISWEEFVSYFADGVMGKEELRHLFDEIDTHNTNNIDTVELCTYFGKHLGEEYKETFGFLEEMNTKMTNVLYRTSKTYQDASRIEKFMNRFFLKEILNQISALQHPFDAALESLDSQAREESSNILPVDIDDIRKPVTSSIIPGRVVRRTKRQVSSMSTGSGEGGPMMNQQIERLAALLDRIERKVNFEGFRDEEVVMGEDDTVLLVQREFVLQPAKLDEFIAQLRAYVDTTQGFRGCLNVSVRELRESHSFTVYELWTTEEKYVINCDSEPTKLLVSQTAEKLEKPETVHSMKIPS